MRAHALYVVTGRKKFIAPLAATPPNGLPLIDVVVEDGSDDEVANEGDGDADDDVADTSSMNDS